MALVYPSVVQGFGQGAETGLNLVRGIADIRRQKEQDARDKVLQEREDIKFGQSQDDRQLNLKDDEVQRERSAEEFKQKQKKWDYDAKIQEVPEDVIAKRKADKDWEKKSRANQEREWSDQAKLRGINLDTENKRNKYFQDMRTVQGVLSLDMDPDLRKNVTALAGFASGQISADQIPPDAIQKVGPKLFQKEMNDRIGKEYNNEVLEGHGYQVPPGAESGKSRVVNADFAGLKSADGGKTLVPMVKLQLLTTDKKGKVYSYEGPIVPVTPKGEFGGDVLHINANEFKKRLELNVAGFGLVDELRASGIPEGNIAGEMVARAHEAKLSTPDDDEFKTLKERTRDKKLKEVTTKAAALHNLKDTGQTIVGDEIVPEAPAESLISGSRGKAGSNVDLQAAARAELARRAAQGK